MHMNFVPLTSKKLRAHIAFDLFVCLSDFLVGLITDEKSVLGA